ncbi:hypothetical protein K6119_18235 [Paracrocinitomix mangrovi]|uniref:hypothetical protein n=1 Tax=Paracrocinitomix mangrovi TaxID=2862509 RepID=UPI001C8DB72A|nr:hypothetical protein [Paracrocinitomix mangrovi]UKN01665.1 hypothetical protein K6119_18235 [Paracrocinitomix mangrovi]
MKKLVLLTCLLVGFVINANAQPPEYDDLVIYYADGDYEKLLKTAEKYTQKDETKSDALPYLYLAKCNFEMSKDQKWKDKFPKAFNDAIRFAGNCIKKDERAGTSVVQDNLGFFTDLKIAVVEDIKNLVAEEAYMKLMGAIAKLHRFAKDDVGSYFLKAGAQYMENDKSGGKITEKEAWEKLDAIQSVENWRSIDFEMLKVGVLVYCKAKIQVMRLKDDAVELLGRVKQWLEHDSEFMAYYDEVIN